MRAHVIEYFDDERYCVRQGVEPPVVCFALDPAEQLRESNQPAGAAGADA
jgi:hypothetical protein